MTKSVKPQSLDPQMSISDSITLLRNDIKKLSANGCLKEAKAICETLERVEDLLDRAVIVQVRKHNVH